MALFDLADLATYLQQDLDTSTATFARQRAEDYLSGELGCAFASAARTFTARVPAARQYQILVGPVTAVTAVSVDGTELAADDWERTDHGVWCAATFGVAAGADTDFVTLAVTYTGGFTEVPTDLAGWGVYLAALAYRMGPLPGVAQETVGGVFTTHDPEITRAGAMVLPDHALRVLRARYGAGRRVLGSAAYR